MKQRGGSRAAETEQNEEPEYTATNTDCGTATGLGGGEGLAGAAVLSVAASGHWGPRTAVMLSSGPRCQLVRVWRESPVAPPVVCTLRQQRGDVNLMTEGGQRGHGRGALPK